MKFEVVCASRTSGDEYSILVDAQNERDAVRKAALMDHIASKARPILNGLHAPMPSHEPPKDYSGFLIELNSKCDTLLRSRLARAPIGTIAVSIIIAMFLWSVIVGVCGITLAIYINDAQQQQRLQRGR